MATMPVTVRPFLHPAHAVLLAFPMALFPTALANDVAYLNTAEMQWSNFAAWAITGALIFGAPVVLWALVDVIRRRGSAMGGRFGMYLLLLIVMWVAGLFNAFQHSRDAWSSVGAAGVLLSILSSVCALAAGCIVHTGVTGKGAVR